MLDELLKFCLVISCVVLAATTAAAGDRKDQPKTVESDIAKPFQIVEIRRTSGPWRLVLRSGRGTYVAWSASGLTDITSQPEHALDSYLPNRAAILLVSLEELTQWRRGEFFEQVLSWRLNLHFGVSDLPVQLPKAVSPWGKSIVESMKVKSKKYNIDLLLLSFLTNIEDLGTLLDSEHPGTRRLAVKALGIIPDTLATEYLVRASANSNNLVRTEALDELARRIPKRLVLQVSGDGFDRSKFESQCAAENIHLTSDNAPDGVLVAEYFEGKGSGYGFSWNGPFSEPLYYGRDITFKLDLLSAKDGQSVLTLKANGTSSPRVTASELRPSALRDFMNKPQYRLACSAIAAYFGSHLAAVKLLEWAVDSPDGLRVLELANFTPLTPREEAYLLVARRDFVAARALGSAAKEPLKLFLGRYIGNPDVGPWDPSVREVRTIRGIKEELPSIGSAASALAEIAGPNDQGDSASLFDQLLSKCRAVGINTVGLAAIPIMAALGSVGRYSWDLQQLEVLSICADCKNPNTAPPSNAAEAEAAARTKEAAVEAIKAIQSRIDKLPRDKRY